MVVYLYHLNPNFTIENARGHLRHSILFTTRYISAYIYHTQGLVNLRTELHIVGKEFAGCREYNPVYSCYWANTD
jgi:hypothetical protein